MSSRIVYQCDACGAAHHDADALALRTYAKQTQAPSNEKPLRGEFCAACCRRLDRAVAAAWRGIERATGASGGVPS